ncbi:MAG: hypothetical protein LUD25_04170 [Coriobacteriaceae bacterium]|nr:hypothetical protein [Coriobacteriaceae bacterium]
MAAEEENPSIASDASAGQAVPQADDAVEPAAAGGSAPEQKTYHQKLRLTIVIAAIVVVVLIVVIVLAIVLGSGASVSPSDTEDIDNVSQESQVQFQPVQGVAIPDFVSVFGKDATKAEGACEESVTVENFLEQASDDELPDIAYASSGAMVDEKGYQVATVVFGYNKKTKLIYASCDYDLDALNIPDADFLDLVSNTTFVTSLLEAEGLSADSYDASALQLDEDASQLTENDLQNLQECVFTLDLSRDDAPTACRITESYDHSIGTVVGDTSVLRTITVELY